ncbi:hypothetical protein HK101_002699, partial [Irineochytrium annulatum]
MENASVLPTGASPSLSGGSGSADLDRAQLQFCSELLKKAARVKDADPFLKPVDPDAMNIPSYRQIIKEPMDLSTVAKKLERGQYRSQKQVKRDLDLMLDNCILFNGANNPYGVKATSMRKYFAKAWDKMPMAVGSGFNSAKKR